MRVPVDCVPVEPSPQVVALLLVPSQSFNLPLVLSQLQLHRRRKLADSGRHGDLALGLLPHLFRVPSPPSVEFLEPTDFIEGALGAAVADSFHDFRFDGRGRIVILAFLRNWRFLFAVAGRIETVFLIHFVDLRVEVSFPLVGGRDEGAGFGRIAGVSHKAGTKVALAMAVVADSGVCHRRIRVVVVVVVMDVVVLRTRTSRKIIVVFTHSYALFYFYITKLLLSLSEH